jgi:cobalamin biosynthesis protein CobT
MTGTAKTKVGGVDPSLLGLVGPFTRIARAMSSQWNVTIIPSGFACMTDGKTIYIPFTSDFLPEAQRQQLHGMLDHEVCHVVEEQEHAQAGRATPMDIMKGEKNKTIRMLTNCVEDVRIETKWSKVYPGVAENLNAINLEAARAWEKKPETRTNFWDRLGCAFILKARGFDPTWVGPETLAALDKVSAELEESVTIRWCQDSYDLAERIYRKLKDDAAETIERDKKAKEEKKKKDKDAKKKKAKVKFSEDEEPAPEGDGEEGEEAGDVEDGATVRKGKDGEAGEGSEVETDDDVGGPESDEDDDKASSGGEDDKAEDEGEEDEDAEEGKSGGEPDEEPEPTEEEVARAKEIADSEASTDDLMGEVKSKAEKEVRTDARAHRRYVPDFEMKKMDKWIKPEPRSDADGNYKRARADVQSQIGTIRAKQLAYIQTITRKRLVPNQDAGRLDTHRLASVRTGSVDVFNYIKKGRNLDTCFEVLLDLSGSMGDGDRAPCAAYYAKRTAIALAEPWESLRIPFELIGFSNNHHRAVYSERDPDAVRRVPFDFFIFKGWNERMAACRTRFSAIKGYQDNADGEAVHAAACRLAVRPEKRRILVVVSDGLPCHAGIDCDSLNDHLRETVRQITRAGIEVIGVGAGTDAPAKFYNKSTGASNMIIKDLNKLATTLFTTLRDRMLK